MHASVSKGGRRLTGEQEGVTERDQSSQKRSETALSQDDSGSFLRSTNAYRDVAVDAPIIRYLALARDIEIGRADSRCPPI